MVLIDTRPISSISQSEDTLPPRDVPQQPPLDAVDLPDDREAPRYQVNPQTDLTTLINTLIGNTDKLQKGMDKMSGWMHSSFVEVKSDMASLRTEVRQEINAVADAAHRPALPPLSECPPTPDDNPWRMGLTFTTSDDGNLLSGGVFDVRPLQCFEFWPKDRFPTCWVRRRPHVKPRDDKVRKEKPLMSQAKAQDEVVDLAERLEFVNTQTPAFSRTFTTFHQPETVEMPFASKGWEAALKAVAEGRPTPPPLDEITNTSMLVPYPSDLWEGVHETFFPRHLEKDVGLSVFGDPCLNMLSKTLIDQEFECRARLSDTLHMQTLLESSMLDTYNTPMHHRFMMLAKLHLRMFVRDAHAFIAKRKQCREHVLSRATVRHEPECFINSCPWGKDLFPQGLVNEVKECLVKDNTTLSARWKIPAQAVPKTAGQGRGQHLQQKRKSNPTHGGAQHAPKRGRGAIAMPPARAAPVVQQPSTCSNTPYSSGMFWAQLDPVSGLHSLTPVSAGPTPSTSGAAFQGSPLQQSPFNQTFRGRGYGTSARGGKGRGQRGGAPRGHQ